jgi:hypothetical protein
MLVIIALDRATAPLRAVALMDFTARLVHLRRHPVRQVHTAIPACSPLLPVPALKATFVHSEHLIIQRLRARLVRIVLQAVLLRPFVRLERTALLLDWHYLLPAMLGTFATPLDSLSRPRNVWLVMFAIQMVCAHPDRRGVQLE